jgi:RND family efflux transporter MFP subunit
MAKNNLTEKKSAEQRHTVNRPARGLLRTLLPLAIVFMGIIIAIAFIKLRKRPRRKEQQIVPPLVKVQQLSVQDIQMVVSGYGTVSPKAEVDLVPEVSGKVISINPHLKAGGFIPAKEQILQIDPRDYKLAVQQAQAAVADADLMLEIEIAEADLARRDWQELHPDAEPNSPLVFRQPHIQQARAALQSAKAQLATAELRLERTSLSLPFDGMVVAETVDLGQYVNTGQPIAQIYSIEAVEIEVPLEDWELAWFNIPASPVAINGHNPSTAGSEAEVRSEFAGGRHIWKGHVVRTTGQVDKTSRMVSVVVEVPEPFKGANGRPPLLPGMFVEVLIKGKTLTNAIAVPRFAIHNKNQLWLVNNDRLHITELDVVRRDKDYAYVTSGLEDGAVIVVSSLDTVTEAMQVRTQAPASAKQAPPDARNDNKHRGDR